MDRRRMDHPSAGTGRVPLTEIIARVVGSGDDLTPDQAEAAFDEIMAGRASDAHIAALLTGLRMKGEVPAEIAGGVRAMRAAMVEVPVEDPAGLVDTCGTGGGTLTTFNISTAAALLAAGTGVRIAKHGNRSFTSRCGSADVLEALDVHIDLTPDAMADVLDDAGIVFMFAPLLHPAMRHVAPIRRELRIPTIMNLLGPLTNPAGARRQVVGVSDPALLELIAGGLAELGHDRALVVHGEPGMDELSPLGTTRFVEVRDGEIDAGEIDPADAFGWTDMAAEELAGGEPDENARIIEDVLAGRARGAARAAVVLNGGAALYMAGSTATLEEGVREAERALDAGAGTDVLDRLREATRAVAAT